MAYMQHTSLSDDRCASVAVHVWRWWRILVIVGVGHMYCGYMQLYIVHKHVVTQGKYLASTCTFCALNVH